MTKLAAALAVIAGLLAIDSAPAFAKQSKLKAKTTKSNVVSVVTVVHACPKAKFR